MLGCSAIRPATAPGGGRGAGAKRTSSAETERSETERSETERSETERSETNAAGRKEDRRRRNETVRNRDRYALAADTAAAARRGRPRDQAHGDLLDPPNPRGSGTAAEAAVTRAQKNVKKRGKGSSRGQHATQGILVRRHRGADRPQKKNGSADRTKEPIRS